jgi:putative DNA primase/helicase
MNAPLDIEQQFAAAMAEHGLVPSEIVAGGRLQRFDGPGEKRGKQSGWYVLHADGISAGAFGDWRTGLTETWCAKAQRAMTSVERQAYRKRIEQSKAAAATERAELAELARNKCATLWDKALPVLRNHPYVADKAITPNAAKQMGEVLLIPLRDAAGVLRCLQFIQPDGAKRFKSGGTVAGCYCVIGGEPGPNAPLLICEGWATACSLHEATGYPVAAAMNAGNLLRVAQSLRANLPNVPMTVCADDDTETDGNPGITKAREAALAVAALLAVPDFGSDRQAGATDFNDLHMIRGVATVQASIKNAAVPCAVGVAEDATVTTFFENAPGNQRPRFEVSASGVFHIGIKHDSKAEADIELPPAWLCDRLEIVGRGEDDAGRGYRILRWSSRGSGTMRVTAFPLAMIGEREGWAMLRERGLAMATSRAALEKLSGYLQTEGSDELHFVTESGGWTHGAYILPSGEVLGKPSAPLYYRGDTSGASAYTTKGALADWRESVARLAHGNTRPMLSLAVAFAAPLLHLVELESGGFHLYGPSGAGKTTSAKIGASVWGAPREQVLSWDATALALANAASARNDGLMLLDEMGQGNPEAVGVAAYRLFNGTGKMQGAKDGGNREQARWRVMVLSTGEIDLAAFMSGGGKRTRAGQEVRLASLPAEAGKGLGAFDQLNGLANSGQLAEAMETAARQTYGVAGRAFVEHVASHSGEITDRLRSAIKKTHARLPEGASGQVRRVAARFAVAAEALEIATDEGMTGWKQGDGLAAVMSCFAGWLSRYGIGNREDEQIIAQAEAWFAAHALSRFIDCFNAAQSRTFPVVHNCAGYRKVDSAGAPFWLVSPGTFVDEIAVGFDKTAAGDVLEKAGILQKGNDGKATSKHKTPDQPKESRRFYKFVKTERKDPGE